MPNGNSFRLTEAEIAGRKLALLGGEWCIFVVRPCVLLMPLAYQETRGMQGLCLILYPRVSKLSLCLRAFALFHFMPESVFINYRWMTKGIL